MYPLRSHKNCCLSNTTAEVPTYQQAQKYGDVLNKDFVEEDGDVLNKDFVEEDEDVLNNDCVEEDGDVLNNNFVEEVRMS